jgi:hypothetical protein
VLALVGSALLRSDRLAFTLGVTNGGPVAVVQPGKQACQGVIDVPQHAAFDSVKLSLGTYKQPGPPVSVTVAEPGGAQLASGRLAGGYPDLAQAPSHSIHVGKVGENRPIVVCVRNDGTRKVAVYGNAAIASPTTATVAGKPLNADLNLAFETEPRSLLSVWPAMADRAALFRARFAGAWTYALLAALVLLAVPALLVRGLAAAEREPQ